MTGKELFERYAGGVVRSAYAPIRRRICGYYLKAADHVVMEWDKGIPLSEFDPFRFVMMPNLPSDWQGFNENANQYNWADIEMPNDKPNLCSRCGNRYNSKKQHRTECMRK